MECYYDELFEVSCEGVTELQHVDCTTWVGGLDLFWDIAIGLKGLIFSMNPELAKRMFWIVKCGLIADFTLMGEVNWKSNTTKYFLRATSFWIPVPPPSIWPYKWSGRVKPRCWFLGVYENYWNLNLKTITFAHDMGGGGSFPMGSSPGLVGEYIPEQTRKNIKELASHFDKNDLIWLFTSGIIPGDATDEERYRLDKMRRDYQSLRSQIAWSYEYVKVDNYIIQMWALAEKMQIRANCWKKYYPFEPKIPQGKVRIKKPDQIFPGIPMNELKLPTPTESFTYPKKPEERGFLMTFQMGINENIPYNSLYLLLLLQEL